MDTAIERVACARPLAENGFADAQLCMGQLYSSGKVPGKEEEPSGLPDLAVAAEWYRRAAEHTPSHHDECRLALASMLYTTNVMKVRNISKTLKLPPRRSRRSYASDLPSSNLGGPNVEDPSKP